VSRRGKSTITAERLMKRLGEDLAYERQRSDAERRATEKDSTLLAEQAPLLQELRAVGLFLDSAYDLINKPMRHAAAIPILLHHLRKPYSEATREVIARSLAIPESASIWSILADMYEREPSSESGVGAKAGLAVALAVSATRDNVGRLATLIRDPRNGSSRLAFVRPLHKYRLVEPIAYETLSELRASDSTVNTNYRNLISWR
jgi:hypothetical protein